MDEKILGTKVVRLSGGNLSDTTKVKLTLVVIDDLTELAKDAAAMSSVVIDWQKCRDTLTDQQALAMNGGTVKIKASEAAGDPLERLLAKMTPEQMAALAKRLTKINVVK